jgi:hypothetical protein
MSPSSGFSVLRPVRRFVIALLIMILSATLLLRLDAAIFEYRVLAVLRQMERLQFGSNQSSGSGQRRSSGSAVSALRAGSEFLRMPEYELV